MIITDKALKDYEECQKNAGELADASGRADDALMDIAIALRTMVIPMDKGEEGKWRIDIQAGAGIVIDSKPELEWKETINKAAALGRAIELAQSAFHQS